MGSSVLERSGAGFDEWEQRISSTFVPLRAHRKALSSGEFHGRVEATPLGSVVLAEVTADEAVVERTPRLIRQDDPEFYKFALQTRGSCVIEQAGRQARLEPGDLTIYDTSRPYRLSCSDRFRMTVAMFPRNLVRLPERRMSGLTAVRLAGDTGLAALITPLMRSLAESRSPERGFIAAHLGDAVVDLVTAAFAEQMALPSRDGAARSHRALVAEVHAYIDRHLADPGLNTQSVAEAHYVSVRHLQKVFEARGTSISALVRTRRLERCHRDMSDPQLAATPLAVIRQRWGFADAAHFSRLFRAAYGESPREFRKHLSARP
ncbi:helix-turn-helix domain-containing protein [Kineosporia sp. J2-2]|uniref:Helix-turn-helix domain-containing protein n=1 Tax=Kineosporia corallincola TaxID=2835133 RepID=A0ABS5THN7_9ACTN|nr:helix-turn-helix domain-containing protein [Kineosporia corallincola]MBT0770610.1 helix-turn-helix domain-containing protein [Kineosporia corallincola]